MVHRLTILNIGKFLSLRREKVSKPESQQGISYNNCVFGQPIPMPMRNLNQPQSKQIEIAPLLKYVVEKTGFNSEMVERVLDVASEYLEGSQ